MAAAATAGAAGGPSSCTGGTDGYFDLRATQALEAFLPAPVFPTGWNLSVHAVSTSALKVVFDRLTDVTDYFVEYRCVGGTDGGSDDAWSRVEAAAEPDVYAKPLCVIIGRLKPHTLYNVRVVPRRGVTEFPASPSSVMARTWRRDHALSYAGIPELVPDNVPAAVFGRRSKSVCVKWAASAMAFKYLVRVQCSGMFGTTEVKEIETSETSCVIDGLDPGVTYQVLVSAKKQRGDALFPEEPRPFSVTTLTREEEADLLDVVLRGNSLQTERLRARRMERLSHSVAVANAIQMAERAQDLLLSGASILAAAADDSAEGASTSGGATGSAATAGDDARSEALARLIRKLKTHPVRFDSNDYNVASRLLQEVIADVTSAAVKIIHKHDLAQVSLKSLTVKVDDIRSGAVSARENAAELLVKLEAAESRASDASDSLDKAQRDVAAAEARATAAEAAQAAAAAATEKANAEIEALRKTLEETQVALQAEEGKATTAAAEAEEARTKAATAERAASAAEATAAERAAEVEAMREAIERANAERDAAAKRAAEVSEAAAGDDAVSAAEIARQEEVIRKLREDLHAATVQAAEEREAAMAADTQRQDAVARADAAEVAASAAQAAADKASNEAAAARQERDEAGRGREVAEAAATDARAILQVLEEDVRRERARAGAAEEARAAAVEREENRATAAAADLARLKASVTYLEQQLQSAKHERHEATSLRLRAEGDLQGEREAKERAEAAAAEAMRALRTAGQRVEELVQHNKSLKTYAHARDDEVEKLKAARDNLDSQIASVYAALYDRGVDPASILPRDTEGSSAARAEAARRSEPPAPPAANGAGAGDGDALERLARDGSTRMQSRQFFADQGWDAVKVEKALERVDHLSSMGIASDIQLVRDAIFEYPHFDDRTSATRQVDYIISSIAPAADAVDDDAYDAKLDE